MALAAILIAIAVIFCVLLAVVVMRIARPAPEAAPPSPPADTAIATDATIAPEILARIQQEVAARLGPDARIRFVRRLETPGSRANSWAQQGRVFIQGSHRTGDRPR
jgi:hypothetical protein